MHASSLTRAPDTDGFAQNSWFPLLVSTEHMTFIVDAHGVVEDPEPASSVRCSRCPHMCHHGGLSPVSRTVFRSHKSTCATGHVPHPEINGKVVDSIRLAPVESASTKFISRSTFRKTQLPEKMWLCSRSSLTSKCFDSSDPCERADSHTKMFAHLSHVQSFTLCLIT